MGSTDGFLGTVVEIVSERWPDWLFNSMAAISSPL
jgi:hypothetical protein